VVQFQVLSGADSGRTFSPARLPATVGRSASDTIQLTDPGVWEGHLRCDYGVGNRVLLTVCPDADARVDRDTFKERNLVNGDVIELGAARLQLWLSPTQLATHCTREIVTWVGLATFVLLQVILIHLLVS